MNTFARIVARAIAACAFTVTTLAGAITPSDVDVVASTRDPQGRVWWVGKPGPRDYPTHDDSIAIGRTFADGSPDYSSFPTRGFLYLPRPTGYTGTVLPSAIAAGADGKITVAAYIGNDTILYRISPDGIADTTLGPDGAKTVLSGGYILNSLVASGDGTYFAAGTQVSGTTRVPAAASFTAAGTTAWSSTYGAIGNGEFRSLAVDSNGSLYAAGWLGTPGQGTRFLATKLSASGQIDTAFASQGTFTTLVGGASLDAGANAILRMASGKLVLGGFANSGASGESTALVRLLANGQLDPTFGTGGQLIRDITLPDNSATSSVVNALTALDTGPDDLIAAGSAIAANSTSYYLLFDLVEPVRDQTIAPPVWTLLGNNNLSRDLVGVHVTNDYRVVTVGNWVALYMVPWVDRLLAATGDWPDPMDTLPELPSDPFPLRIDVAPGSQVEWSTTLTGFNAPLAVTVQGGQWALHCNPANYTSEPGYVLLPGSQFCVRQTASPVSAQVVTTNISIGDWSGTAQSKSAIDLTPPHTTFTSTPPTPTSFTVSTFTFDAGELVTFECRADAQAFAPCTSPFTITLGYAAHTVYVRATDPSGNLESPPASYSWNIVQPVEPQTAITSGPGANTDFSDVTFAFASTPPDNATFECSVDGAAFSACASPLAVNGLADGSHAFQVRAVRFGLTDQTPASQAFVVNTSTPFSTIDSHLTGASYGNFTFHASKPTVTFECSIVRPTVFYPCTSPRNYTGLPSGSTYFQVRATDTAGRVENSPYANYHWNAFTALDTVLLSVPPVTTSAPSATFEFAGDMEDASFECSLNGEPFAACASPHTVDGLPHGTHNFQVRSVLEGSVDETPAAHTWSVVAAGSLQIVATAKMASGHILMLAQPHDNPRQIAIGRRLPDGSPDSAFGTQGWMFTSAPETIPGDLMMPTALLATAGGGYIAAFSLGGKVGFDLGGQGVMMDMQSDNLRVNALLEMPDGTLVAAGSYRFAPESPRQTALVRYSANGLRDPSWGMGVRVYGLSGGENEARAATLDASGNILVAGWGYNGSDKGFVVARINMPYGDQDMSFHRPWVALSPMGSDNALTSIVSLGSGKILAAGRGGYLPPSAPGKFAVVRMMSDGTLDPGFGYGGVWTADLMQGGDAATSLAALGTGPDDFVAGGYAMQQPDGDGMFAIAGMNVYSSMPMRAVAMEPGTAGNDDEIVGVHITPDYRLIAVGNRSNIHGSQPRVVRFIATTGRYETNFTDGTVWFDSTPDIPFNAFPPLMGVPTQEELNWPVYVGGFEAPAPISVQGGEWSRNCDPSAYTSAPGWLPGPGYVCVRRLSAATTDTPSDVAVTIGGWNGFAHAMTHDTTPETYITKGPRGVSNDATFYLASDVTGTFECSLDGQPFTPCGSPVTYPNLVAGVHRLDVRVVVNGMPDPTPATRLWVAGTPLAHAPAPDLDTVILSFDPASVAFEMTPSLGGSFECRMDGSTYAPCARKVAYPQIADGPHMFYARAVNEDGMPDATPATRSFTIVRSPPDTQITSGPSGPTPATTAAFTFVADQPGVTFQCALDGASFTPCASPKTYNNVSQGTHTFRVRAIDGFGNMDPTPDTRAWTVDTTPPSTSITSRPPSSTTATTATFGFTSSEPGSSFQCRLDAGAWVSCTSPTTYNGLARISHTFRVRATDAAGNQDTTGATATWTIH